MEFLHQLSLSRQRDLITHHELSVAELLEHYLDRQQRLNPVLEAFSLLEHERARNDLDRYSQQTIPPEYFGIITADKDLDRRAGSPNFRGSITTGNAPADVSDAVTQSADNAGVISTGRTRVPEFGLSGNALGSLPTTAKNPWNLHLDPGGSSSGAAAAVAAGLLPVALASDAGGSIRIPAASCGVVGFKPGRQYLPYDGQHMGNRNSVHGSIARNVHDATLLLSAMGAPKADAERFTMLSAPDEPLTIIATTYTPWSETLNISLPAATLSAWNSSIEMLEALGHRVVQKDFSNFSGYAQSFVRLWQSSAATITVPHEQEENLYFFTRWLRHEGTRLSEDQVLADLAVMDRFENFFDQETVGADAILTPALGLLPQSQQWHAEPDPVRNFEKQCEYSPYSSYVNMIGRPAITVPVDLGNESTYNIPTSVQFIGQKRNEVTLARLAHQVEQFLNLSIAYPESLG